MKPNAPRSASELAAMVQEFSRQKKQSLKQAADGAAPADPNDKGTVTIPTQPDAEDPNKLQLPKESKPTNSEQSGANTSKSDSVATVVTNPAPSGAGTVPSTADGNAEDKRLSEKLASLAANIQSFKSKLAGGEKKAGEAAPAGTTAAPAAAAPATTEKKAGEATPEITEETVKQAHDLYAHIGAMVCGDEEGRKLVESMIFKQAGELKAAEMLQQAKQAAEIYQHVGAVYAAEQQFMQEEMQKQAAAQQQLAVLVQQKYASLKPEQQEFTLKIASALTEDIAAGFVDSDLTEAYWTKGAAAAEAMMGGEAPPDMGSAPIPGGDGQPTPEMIIQAVMEALAAGEITEEEAKAMLTQFGIDPATLAGAGGAAAPEPSPEQKEAAEQIAKLL